MADLIISRKEARLQGLKLYFTGKPCKHGHLSRRRVSKSDCLECERAHGGSPQRLQQKRKWRKNNMDKGRRYAQEWRDKNTEQNRQQVKEWRTKNPSRVRQQNEVHRRLRRAREWLASGRFTSEDVLEIMRAQKGRCAYCAKNIRRKYHVDHIVPLVRGGSNERKNLQLTCPDCNRKKNRQDPLRFTRSLGKLL